MHLELSCPAVSVLSETDIGDHAVLL